MGRLTPYELRVGIGMVVYVAGIFAASYLINVQQVSGLLAWVLALIPGVAMAGMVYAQGVRIAEQKDEFMRMLLVRQHLIATGITLSVATAWALLETFELVGDRVSPVWILVVFTSGLAIGAVSNRITYGTWGRCR